MCAANALGLMGPIAEGPLNQALEMDDKIVRKYAKKALKEIKRGVTYQ